MKIAAVGFIAFSLFSTPLLAQDINDPASTAGVLKARREEAAIIKNFPSIASREGDVLTLSRGGHPVARLTDQGIQHCDGMGTCNVWRFLGMVSLQVTSHRHETYAEVTHLDGEDRDFLLIGEDGTAIWLDDEPMASPDGRYVATGETAGLSDSPLVIIDWTSPGRRASAVFNSACQPVGWLDAATLNVICSRNDKTSGYVLATVKAAGPKAWRLQETQVVDDYRTRKPVNDPGFKPRSEMAAITVVAAASARKTAEAGAGHREDGYEKLN